MDQATKHQMLLTQVRTFQGFLLGAGYEIPIAEDKDLEKLSDTDLAALVRSLRDLARTPH